MKVEPTVTHRHPSTVPPPESLLKWLVVMLSDHLLDLHLDLSACSLDLLGVRMSWKHLLREDFDGFLHLDAIETSADAVAG